MSFIRFSSVVLCLFVAGCNNTLLKSDAKSSESKTVTASDAVSTKSEPKSLQSVAEEAMKSKGALTEEQINAILKTQSVCRAADYQ